MARFLGIVRYEYRMAIGRWGMWIGYALAAWSFVGGLLTALAMGMPIETGAAATWSTAGSLALMLNLLTPVVGGIVLADRLVRDRRLGVRELLAATPVSRRTYVLGKYAGAVAAALTPVLAVLLLMAALLLLHGAPLALLPATLLAFLAITVPAFAFVGAFSLACPVVLPLRVYQILFVGYWFWGNLVSPDMIPTLNGTLLTASGEFVGSAFFQGTSGNTPPHTPLEAVLNIVVLLACAAAALVALERYLAWQERRA
jgi:ABC-2 type transport system permease protein